MKADSVVILGAAATLFLLGVVGFMITDIEINKELIPGGDPDNDSDYVDIQSEIRPFLKVGVSSIVFGLIILLVFVLAVGVSRLRK
jgi:hypothetical protein